MLPNCGIEKLGEPVRGGPSSLDLGQHGRDDRRERSFRGFGGVSFPDPHHVREQAEGYPGIVGALMLEQQIDVRVATMQIGREQEVAMTIGQLGIDEAAGLEPQRALVDGTGELGGKDVAKLRGGVLRVLEGAFEQRVVGRARHPSGWLVVASRRRLLP